MPCQVGVYQTLVFLILDYLLAFENRDMSPKTNVNFQYLWTIRSRGHSEPLQPDRLVVAGGRDATHSVHQSLGAEERLSPGCPCLAPL